MNAFIQPSQIHIHGDFSNLIAVDVITVGWIGISIFIVIHKYGIRIVINGIGRNLLKGDYAVAARWSLVPGFFLHSLVGIVVVLIVRYHGDIDSFYRLIFRVQDVYTKGSGIGYGV